MSLLAGKVAMVTGGASGIGRASAMLMASQGAKVSVTDINADGAAAVAAEIAAAGLTAVSLSCDIGDEDSVRAAVAQTVEHYGRLDVLHNNAALIGPAVMELDTDILAIPTDMWDRTMAVTLRGTMLGCRYGVRAMCETGGGSIINTSSTFGLSPHNSMVAYGVAKAGVNMLTQYVATAFGRRGIRCNAIAPSMILTPPAFAFIPEGLRRAHEDATLLGVLGEPDDIAHAVAFLASDASKYITGQVIAVDGGTTAHLPTYGAVRAFEERS